MTEIVDRAIWLGSKYDAENVDFLVKNKITHIINVCGKIARPVVDESDVAKIKDIVYIEIEAIDHPMYPILQNHGRLVSKIMFDIFKENHEKNRILIHCYAGINRSATLLINFLKEFMYPDDSVYDIIDSVRTLRPIILSNKGFESQLLEKFN
jgi:predicted protein tyrosine phosphatase